MRREKLSPDEIESALAGLKGWKWNNDSILRRFEFADFAHSLAFVNKIGGLAERADHHPDITFGWGYAEISLTTHDRGGVTDVDIALAKEIDLV